MIPACLVSDWYTNNIPRMSGDDPIKLYERKKRAQALRNLKVQTFKFLSRQ